MTGAADPVAAFVAAHAAGDEVLLGSSGSTGAPRGVVRSTASWVDSFDAVRALCGLDEHARVWVPGPLEATMNLFAAVLVRFTGAETVTTPGTASHAFLTPAALRGHLRDLAGSTVVVAGDRLDRPLAGTASARGCTVHHYYGAAELSFVAWGQHADDLLPFPGAEVEVRDGEIWVRSPYLLTRYDGPPGALRRDADGFATVGDRGVFDGERLVVHGRPDSVTTGATTVLVADVEAVLCPHADGEVVVLGVPHPELGALVAAVLTDAGDLAALKAAARGSLRGAHRPRLWFQLSPLPRTDAGKVDRTALTAALGRAAARRLV